MRTLDAIARILKKEGIKRLSAFPGGVAAAQK